MRIKSFFNKTAVMAAVAAACLGTSAMAADVIGTGLVDGDSLRVRSEASTGASIVTYLSDKTQVQVYEDLGEWYKVSYGSYTGYVSADYLVYTPAAAAATSNAAAPAAAANEDAGVIIGSCVNFRTAPSTDSGALTQLSRDTQITVLSVTEDGSWCQAAWNGQTGYVKADYVAVNGIPLADPTGTITADSVNLRATPSTDGAIVTKFSAGTEIVLTALADGWYSASYDGLSGYVRADYVRLGHTPAASTIGATIVETAKKYLGTPYAYGGASGKGFDCSGFTMYIFSLHGYSLPHSATSQWNSSGVYVEKSDLQPGDLVLFNDPARNAGKACSHVGIYIGDNQFIHSSSGRSGGVIISSLSENYYSSYYKGAKRVG